MCSSDLPGLSLEAALKISVEALAAGSPDAARPGPGNLEVALLERSRPRRKFRRLSADRLAGLLGVPEPPPQPAGVAESPDSASVED